LSLIHWCNQFSYLNTFKHDFSEGGPLRRRYIDVLKYNFYCPTIQDGGLVPS